MALISSSHFIPCHSTCVRLCLYFLLVEMHSHRALCNHYSISIRISSKRRWHGLGFSLTQVAMTVPVPSGKTFIFFSLCCREHQRELCCWVVLCCLPVTDGLAAMLLPYSFYIPMSSLFLMCGLYSQMSLSLFIFVCFQCLLSPYIIVFIYYIL